MLLDRSGVSLAAQVWGTLWDPGGELTRKPLVCGILAGELGELTVLHR